MHPIGLPRLDGLLEGGGGDAMRPRAGSRACSPYPSLGCDVGDTDKAMMMGRFCL